MEFQLDDIQEIFTIAKDLPLLEGPETVHASKISKLNDLFYNLLKATAENPDILLECIHDNYLRLIDCIFGGNGFVGIIKVISDSYEKGSSPTINQAVNGLLQSLSPGGDFFSLVMFLQQEEKKYLFPSEILLPKKSDIKSQYELETLNSLRKKAIYHNSQLFIQLSAYEVYIYYSLAFPLREDFKPAPLAFKKPGFFERFVDNLLQDVFPIILPESNEISQLEMYFTEDSFDRSSFLPQFFLDVFFRLWFGVVDEVTKPSPYTSQAEHKHVAIRATGLALMKQLCLHFQGGYVHLLGPSNQPTRQLFEEFWCFIRARFQPQLFRFFKKAFVSQSFSSEFLAVVELWVSYISCWEKMGIKDISLIEFFVADNYLFYKELLLDFLYRCLEIHFLAESLGRTMLLRQSERILLNLLSSCCNEKILGIIKEADAALNFLSIRLVLPFKIDPDTSTTCFSLDKYESGFIESIVESHLKRFSESSVFDNCPISSARIPNWKNELHSVFLGLSDICDPSSQLRRSSTIEHSIPKHWFYESITGFFRKWFYFLPGDRALMLAQSNYLTPQQYKDIADYIAKLITIPSQ